MDFPRGGKYVLTGDVGGIVQMWFVDPHDEIQYLCSVLLRDFTEDERAQYGITDDAPTCPERMKEAEINQ